MSAAVWSSDEVHYELWSQPPEPRDEARSGTDAFTLLTNRDDQPNPTDREELEATLVDQWITAAMEHAYLRRLDYGWYASIAGVDGAWGEGKKRKHALADLEVVLREWAAMKLADGDDDIPAMEGLTLVVR